MTNYTKIKARLQYSSSLGCIVRSTLNQNYCKVETYDDIYNKVSDIKQENAVAKYIRAYILQASSLVSHLTKNDFILTKLQENRWKSSGNNNNNVVEKNHLASHIVYYLASSDISINEEVLVLKGQAKGLFNETKFSDKVLSIDSIVKAEAAAANSNIVYDSMATEILPVKDRPKQWEEALKLTMQGKLYSIHVQRLPSLPLSNFGLEILIGKDEMIDFEDFLG
ncbi:27948_t:CDS:2, partial [Dentiscutata erythropus]